MRNFSKVEQRILEEIVLARKNKDIARLSLDDIIAHEMEKVHCDIIDWRKDDSVNLYFYKPATQDDVTFCFLDLMVLFEYLDRDGLVHIFEKDNHSGQKAIFSRKKYKYNEATDEYTLLSNGDISIPKGKFAITGIDILSYNIVPPPSLKLIQLLDKYSHAIIYPTSTLENYVNNGYKTDEDIKFEKQYQQTKISIWIAIVSCFIAFITGLASIILNIFMLGSDTCIDNSQQTEIIETIKESKTIIPSIIDTRLTNDTLKINIVNSVPMAPNNDKQ